MVRREQELERAGIQVGDRAACTFDIGFHRRSGRFVQGRRGRFLDQLLVPSLDRALPLAERQYAAVRVAEHLYLDVPSRCDQLLEVEAAVTESGECLRVRALEGLVEVLASLDETHPFATAPGRSFQKDGVADLRCCGTGFLEPDGLGSRYERNTSLGKLALGLHLVAHARHDIRIGADEDELVLLAGSDEVGILGEEAVAGMHGLAPGRFPGRHNRGDVQVTLRSARRTNADGAVGQARVERAPVSSRVDGHGFDAELVQRTDDAHRDLATVRNEHAREHR